MRRLLFYTRAILFWRKLLALVLVAAWVFSGWPAIPVINFPPKINEARAAHTFDNSAQSTAQTTDPATLAYTTGTGATVLVAMIAHTQASRTGGAPTFNGLTMIQVGSEVLNGQEVGAEMWYLVDPPIGTFTISVPNSGLVRQRIYAASFIAGSGFTSALDVSNSTNTDAANPSLLLTTTVNGAVVVDVLSDGLGTVPTARSHTLIANADEGALVNEAQYALQATAGNITLSHTIAVDDVAMIAAAFKPVALPTTFTQDDYRWYVDSDAENVTDPWGIPDIAENTALAPLPVGNDPPGPAQELRLRVNFTVNNANLSASSKQFKLQYKAGTDESCTTGSWIDVGAGAGAEIWRFATSGVTDGADLTSAKFLTTDVLEEYAKSNPTQTNHNSATVGQDIEYDFHIEHNGATDATKYSFRAVESDGTIFGTYNICPTLTTQPGTGNLIRHGNFFSSEAEQGFSWAD